MRTNEISQALSAGGDEADRVNARIELVIRKTNGNMRKIAEQLGVSRSCLYDIFNVKRGYRRLVKEARANAP